MATPTVIDDIDGLTPKQRAHCRRAGIYSAEQLLLIPLNNIVKQCHVERAEATLIHRLAAISLGAPSTSAFHTLTGRPQSPFPAANPIQLPLDSNKTERMNSKPRHNPTIDPLDSIWARTDRLEVVAATQGAEETGSGMQSSQRPNVAQPYGFFGEETSTSAWPVYSATDDVVPGSQGDEESDVYQSMIRSSPPSVLAILPTTEGNTQSPSTKALGKRRALADDDYPLQRSKRRLIATSDEEDLSSDSEGGQQDLDRVHEQPRWLTSADVQDSISRLWLSTGEVRLDRILGGGMRRGTVTEIVGESSSGKTQLVLQMAVHTVLGIRADEPDVEWDPSRRPSGVAILTPHGEAAASSLISRLVELATALPQCRPRNAREGDGRGGRRRRQGTPASIHNLEDSMGEHVDVILRNVHVACLRDADALDHALAYTLPGLQQRLRTGNERDKGPLDLVIIEGLPAFLQDDSVDMNKFQGRFMRAKLLCSIADKLRCLSLNSRSRNGNMGATTVESCVRHEDYGPAILVINHVSDAFDREAGIVRAVLQEGHFSIHELQLHAAASENERTLPSTLAISAESALDPPLAFDLQSIHSSGLLSTIPSSVGAAGIRPQRDASGHELPLELDDFARALKGRLKSAQLGNVWANCINARLVLSRTARRVPTSIIPSVWQGDKGLEERKSKSQLRVLPVRRANLAFSSFVPSGIGSNASLDFVITSGRGMQAIPDEQDLDSLSLTQAQRRRSQNAKAEPAGPGGDDFDTLFNDFDDEVEHELERLAFDVEMDAALASIPDHVPSQEEQEDEENERSSGAIPSSSALVATQLLASQQHGVVPASSLPILADTGVACAISPDRNASELVESSTTADDSVDDATQPLPYSQD
ncbi:hypothetical protein CF327_g3781 [Tilletia walkeri]|nr:hypothetical protein CF327_g3781 [Tilletia walkeri]